MEIQMQRHIQRKCKSAFPVSLLSFCLLLKRNLSIKYYLARLNKVQETCKARWKEVDNFGAIQLSMHAHKISPCMILASIFFWKGSTNTFQLPCGMPSLAFQACKKLLTQLCLLNLSFTSTVRASNFI